MSDAGKSAGKSRKRLPRSRARLAAVQALYQMDLAETDLAAVLEEFSAPLVDDAEADGMRQARRRPPHARAEGCRHAPARDRPLIDQQLAHGWRLARIDSIVRAILRAASFELIERPTCRSASSSASTSRWRTPSSRATSRGRQRRARQARPQAAPGEPPERG